MMRLADVGRVRGSEAGATVVAGVVDADEHGDDVADRGGVVAGAGVGAATDVVGIVIEVGDAGLVPRSLGSWKREYAPVK